MIWETNVRPDAAPKYFFHGDVLVTPELIVAGADVPAGAAEAGVHAFDRETGKERWRHPAGRGTTAPLAGDGQRIISSTIERGLISLALASGKSEWSAPVKSWGYEGPDVASGRVFVGTAEGALVALNADTGNEVWRTELGSPISTSVRAGTDAVYAGTKDGRIHRVNPSTGKVTQTLTLDTRLRPGSMPMLAGNGVLVLLADDEQNYRALVSLDSELQAVRWRTTPPDRWSTTRIFVWRDAAILGMVDGQVTAYCLKDGRADWSHRIEGTVRAIGGAPDAVYISTPQGSLSAVRPPETCASR